MHRHQRGFLLRQRREPVDRRLRLSCEPVLFRKQHALQLRHGRVVAHDAAVPGSPEHLRHRTRIAPMGSQQAHVKTDLRGCRRVHAVRVFAIGIDCREKYAQGRRHVALARQHRHAGDRRAGAQRLQQISVRIGLRRPFPRRLQRPQWLATIDPGHHRSLAMPAVAPARARKENLVRLRVLVARVVGTRIQFACAGEPFRAGARELQQGRVVLVLAQQVDAHAVAGARGPLELRLQGLAPQGLGGAEVVAVVPDVGCQAGDDTGIIRIQRHVFPCLAQIRTGRAVLQQHQLDAQLFLRRQAVRQGKRPAPRLARGRHLAQLRVQPAHVRMRQRELRIQLQRTPVQAERLFPVTARVGHVPRHRERLQRFQARGGHVRQRHRGLLHVLHRLAELLAQLVGDLVDRGQRRSDALAVGGHRIHGGLGARVDHLRADPQATTDLGHGRQQQRARAIALRDFRTDGAVDPRARLRLHASKGLAHLQVADHVDVAGLLQADPERLLQRLVQARIAGQVAQVADHHPVAFAEGDRRLRAGQEPAAEDEARQQQGFRGQRHRPPPQRQVAPGLGRVRGHAQRCQPGLADFEHFLRFRHALEAPAAIGLPHQQFAALAQFTRGAVRQRFGGGGQQDLPRPREGHQATGQRLGQAFDLQRLGADADRVGTVLPHQHLTHVQAGARLQRLLELAFAAEVAQPAHVVEGKAKAVDRTFEQQQQAVAAVDQAAAPALLQRKHDAVVRAEQFRRRAVAEHLDQLGGVHQVGEQQGADLRGIAIHAHRRVSPATRRDRRRGAWPGTARYRPGCTSAPSPPPRPRCTRRG